MSLIVCALISCFIALIILWCLCDQSLCLLTPAAQTKRPRRHCVDWQLNPLAVPPRGRALTSQRRAEMAGDMNWRAAAAAAHSCRWGTQRCDVFILVCARCLRQLGVRWARTSFTRHFKPSNPVKMLRHNAAALFSHYSARRWHVPNVSVIV